MDRNAFINQACQDLMGNQKTQITSKPDPVIETLCNDLLGKNSNVSSLNSKKDELANAFLESVNNTSDLNEEHKQINYDNIISEADFEIKNSLEKLLKGL